MFEVVNENLFFSRMLHLAHVFPPATLQPGADWPRESALDAGERDVGRAEGAEPALSRRSAALYFTPDKSSNALRMDPTESPRRSQTVGAENVTVMTIAFL